MKNKQKKLLPVLAGTGMALIWGFSFLFTKEVLDYTTPLQILGYRFATAALVITLLKVLRVIPVHLKGKPWSRLLLLSLFQPGLYFLGETWGIKWTSASEAGMIIALVPVAVAIMAWIFLKEKLQPLQILAILTSVIGVIIIVANQEPIGMGEHFWGVIVLLIAVLAAGAYSVLSKKSSAQFNPWEITFVMMWSATILFNILGLIQGLQEGSLLTYLQPLTIKSVQIAVLYLGVLSSIVAFYLSNYMIANLTVARYAPFTNLVTVVTVFAGVFFRGEHFSLKIALGVALIIFGVWGTTVFEKPMPFKEQLKRLE